MIPWLDPTTGAYQDNAGTILATADGDPVKVITAGADRVVNRFGGHLLVNAGGVGVRPHSFVAFLNTTTGLAAVATDPWEILVWTYAPAGGFDCTVFQDEDLQLHVHGDGPALTVTTLFAGKTATASAPQVPGWLLIGGAYFPGLDVVAATADGGSTFGVTSLAGETDTLPPGAIVSVGGTVGSGIGFAFGKVYISTGSLFSPADRAAVRTAGP